MVLFMVMLMRSSYGRAMKAVRDDDLAAEAMGVNVFKTKVTAFTVSSFWAGVGGALLGHQITTIDPKMFTFSFTFNIVLIVVLGGTGSITGSVLAAIFGYGTHGIFAFPGRTDGLPLYPHRGHARLAHGGVFHLAYGGGHLQTKRNHGR